MTSDSDKEVNSLAPVSNKPEQENQPSYKIAPPRWNVVGWAVISFLLVLQYGLFRQFIQRDIAWGYATAHDQTTYLLASYEGYEEIRSNGVAAGVLHAFNLRHPTGVMLYLQASLLYLLLGVSRLSALTLNFAYFALLQVVVAGTLRWLTKSWAITFLGIGLLLALITPFFWAGGIADFRIDHIAFCLFGVFVSLVIRSKVFSSWTWSAVVGGAASWLVLFRFLTIVYLLGILGLVFLFLIGKCVWYRRRNLTSFRLSARQVCGLAIAGLILLTVTGPVLWYNRAGIQAYYVVGHLTGAEKEVRAQEAGIVDTESNLLYYPNSLLEHHVGHLFLVLSVLAIISSFFLGWTGNWKQRLCSAFPGRVASLYLLVIICLIVPLVVLTINVAKSPVVGGILVGPLFWLVMLTVGRLLSMPKSSVTRGRIYRPGTLVLGAVILLSGVYNQFDNWSRPSDLSRRRSDVEQVLSLYNQIWQYSKQMGWAAPQVSNDLICDYFNHMVLKTWMYENTGSYLDVRPGLDSSIFALTEAEAISHVENSDFVLMTTLGENDVSPFPFAHSMQQLRPKLLELCNRRLLPLQQYYFFGRKVTLYARPVLKVEAVPGSWVTVNGLTLSGSSDTLHKWPKIDLCGESNYPSLAVKVPQVSAQLLVLGQAPKTIETKGSANGQNYCIQLGLNPKDIQPNGSAKIRLVENTGRLIIKAPERATLLQE